MMKGNLITVWYAAKNSIHWRRSRLTSEAIQDRKRLGAISVINVIRAEDHWTFMWRITTAKTIHTKTISLYGVIDCSTKGFTIFGRWKTTLNIWQRQGQKQHVVRILLYGKYNKNVDGWKINPMIRYTYMCKYNSRKNKQIYNKKNIELRNL